MIVGGSSLLVYYRDYPIPVIAAVREIIGTVGGGFLLIKRNVFSANPITGQLCWLNIAFRLFYLFNWPFREYTIPPLLFVFAGGIFAYTKTYGCTILKGSDSD
ncbi:MAG: hypothetical protein U1F27_02305 [Turneriella sp.]